MVSDQESDMITACFLKLNQISLYVGLLGIIRLLTELEKRILKEGGAF